MEGRINTGGKRLPGGVPAYTSAKQREFVRVAAAIIEADKEPVPETARWHMRHRPYAGKDEER